MSPTYGTMNALYMEKDMDGVKHDNGKLPMHLMSVPAMHDVARVLEFGQKKYEPRNWEKGMAWSRVYAALLRHLTAWWNGEDIDPESGLPHLAHVATCAMFLQQYEKYNPEYDDRPKLGAPK